MRILLTRTCIHTPVQHHSDRQRPTQPAWGAFAPKGFHRHIRRLVAIGLSRGPVKKWIQRRWFSTGNLQPVDLFYHGIKMRLHPWDNAIENKILFGSRMRDRTELRALADHLPPDGTFADVGANVGYYSLMLATGVGCKVVAIEPNPTAFERLQFNIQINGHTNRIYAVQCAVGSERKPVLLTVGQSDMGSSSVARNDVRGEQIEVLMQPLLDVLAAQRIESVDAMKIDVEGIEDRVLCPFYESAPRSLWPRFVVMEDVHRSTWKRDLLQVMRDCGYTELGRSRSNVFMKLSK